MNKQFFLCFCSTVAFDGWNELFSKARWLQYINSRMEKHLLLKLASSLHCNHKFPKKKEPQNFIAKISELSFHLSIEERPVCLMVNVKNSTHG